MTPVAIVQTFIRRDHTETAALLGEGGAWIETNGEEFLGDRVAGAFARYEVSNMKRVWRDEDPYPAADGGSRSFIGMTHRGTPHRGCHGAASICSRKMSACPQCWASSRRTWR